MRSEALISFSAGSKLESKMYCKGIYVIFSRGNKCVNSLLKFPKVMKEPRKDGGYRLKNDLNYKCHKKEKLWLVKCCHLRSRLMATF